MTEWSGERWQYDICVRDIAERFDQLRLIWIMDTLGSRGQTWHSEHIADIRCRRPEVDGMPLSEFIEYAVLWCWKSIKAAESRCAQTMWPVPRRPLLQFYSEPSISRPSNRGEEHDA